MKTLIIGIVSLLSIQFSTAQNKADQILNQVKDNFFANTLTLFNFNLTIENKEADVKQEKIGELTTGKDQYVLNLKGDAIIYFNGKTQWTVFEDDEEVQISEIEDGEENGLSFAQYFEDYKEKYSISSSNAENGLTRVILIPKDKETDTQQIELMIKTDDSSIHSLTEFGKNGTNRIIEVSSYKVLENGSVEFSPNMESFKDFDIIDMR